MSDKEEEKEYLNIMVEETENSYENIPFEGPLEKVHEKEEDFESAFDGLFFKESAESKSAQKEEQNNLLKRLTKDSIENEDNIEYEMKIDESDILKEPLEAPFSKSLLKEEDFFKVLRNESLAKMVHKDDFESAQNEDNIEYEMKIDETNLNAKQKQIPKNEIVDEIISKEIPNEIIEPPITATEEIETVELMPEIIESVVPEVVELFENKIGGNSAQDNESFISDQLPTYEEIDEIYNLISMKNKSGGDNEIIDNEKDENYTKFFITEFIENMNDYTDIDNVKGGDSSNYREKIANEIKKSEFYDEYKTISSKVLN